ncbi:MAG: SpoIID/LytB domain-containing protein [Patescibacteria group bacterium]
MKKWVIFFVFVLLFITIVPNIGVYADDYDQVTHELEETKKLLDMSVSATQTNEKQLADLNKRLNGVRAKVRELKDELKQKEVEIENGDKRFAKIQNFLNEKIAAHYKRLLFRQSNGLSIVFTDSLTNSINNSFYQSSTVENNQQMLITIALQIKNLEETKATLAKNSADLEVINKELDRQTSFLSGEVASAKTYQSELQKKIADLSAKQQSILAARASQVLASVGESELEYDDYNASREFTPPFSPGFAVFSIGAFTHRKGMSQYGAKARADAGQNVSDILKAYYPNTSLETKGDLPGSINVEGVGEISFEDNYLLGISEMPSNWPKEALKAQAVAARTYALRYIGWPGASRSICTTESCQVYRSSKAASPPDAWRQAVSETKGQILLEGGSPAGTFYSSTSGGYLTTSGWDTTDGQGTNFLENAWERKAKSPWFYKAWYRSTYSNSSDSCGRSHPWLTESEFADILNAWQVRAKGSGDEVSRILPVTINSCNVGGVSGNPYSIDEMAGVADKYGGKFTSISSVSVSFGSDGTTSNVTVSTNRGQISINGAEFKQAYNLRAPGYISVKNVLFNVERK